MSAAGSLVEALDCSSVTTALAVSSSIDPFTSLTPPTVVTASELMALSAEATSDSEVDKETDEKESEERSLDITVELSVEGCFFFTHCCRLPYEDDGVDEEEDDEEDEEEEEEVMASTTGCASSGCTRVVGSVVSVGVETAVISLIAAGVGVNVAAD